MQEKGQPLFTVAAVLLVATAIWPLSRILVGNVEAQQAQQPQKQKQGAMPHRSDDNSYDIAAMYKHHFNKISDQYSTGAQPPLDELARLKAEGYTTIINLRVPREHDAAAEEQEAKRLGLRYFNIPVVYLHPQAEQVTEFLRLTDDPANRRTLVHCTMNIRAGAFFAIRRVLRDGWTFDDAEKEAAKGAPIAPHLKQFALDYIAKHRGQ